MDFGKGDTVVCINNDNRGYTNLYLTLYKVYTVVDNDSSIGTLWVKDDSGRNTNYVTERFVSLSEYRTNIIDDILE